MALAKIIELNFDKKVSVIYDGNIPKDLRYIPLRDEACYYKNIPEGSKFDLYILVDYGTKIHLGGVEDFVKNSDFIIEFDHHYNDDVYGDLCFDDVNKAATAQIIFDVVRKAKFKIDKDIIDLLMLAIITDTGNFKFVRNSDVFIDAAQLVDMGADVSNIVNLLNNKDKKTVLVESLAAANAEFHMNGRLVMATISGKDYKKLDGRGELVLDILAKIHGVEFVVLLKEHLENQIGISFRSKTIPVNEIAESFGGGGHLFAAGAVIMDTLENVHKKVLNSFRGL